jgi:hypothetical protein
MRELVASLAILAAVVEALAAIAGPAGTGVKYVTDQPVPAMETGPLLVGLAVAGVSLVAGVLVAAGWNGQRAGVVLIVAAVVGAFVVSPWTLWFTFGAVFALLAGVIALFIRKPRSPSG